MPATPVSYVRHVRIDCLIVTVICWCLTSDTFAQSSANRVEAFKQSSAAIATDVRRLTDQRPAVVSESLVMNTVRQYSRRPDLDGFLAERSAEAKVWEKRVADGEAQRMRIRNPYSAATYDKYYDKKGDWQFSVIENDYNAAEKTRADWSSAYTRARASVDDLQRQYDAIATGRDLPSSMLT